MAVTIKPITYADQQKKKAYVEENNAKVAAKAYGNNVESGLSGNPPGSGLIGASKGSSSSSGPTIRPANSDYQQVGAGSQTNAQKEEMSDADKAALEAAGAAWGNATTQEERDKAHADAEAIRAKYGYSGGHDGSDRLDPVTGNKLGDSINNDSVNNGYKPSYADDYAQNGAADKYGVDHQYAKDEGMDPADYQALVAAGENYNMYAAQMEQALANATSEGEKAKIRDFYKGYMDAEHEKAEKIRAQYGYSGGVDGSEYIPTLQGDRYVIANKPVQSGTSSGTSLPSAPTLDPLPERPELPETPDFKSTLDQWLNAAQQQQEAKIDYATQQGITELQRAEQDAQEQFQTQRDQVAADEAKALDNQALYAERRGDRGGIGAVQYAAIQNAAMENRRAVNQAQTKLATDTSRQIADLRAQGEFEKADALLEITKTYLSKLMEVEQWSAEYNLEKVKLEEAIREWEAGYGLDVAKFEENIRQWEATFKESIRQWEAEFAESVRQWEAEFGLSEGSLMGSYQGSPTLSATQNSNKNMADAGWTMLQNGIIPSASQLNAMGISKNQATEYLEALKLSQSSGGSGGGVKLDDVETDMTISEKLKTFNTESEARAYLLDQKVTESRYDEYMDLFYEYQEQKEKEKMEQAAEDKRVETANFGTMYDLARNFAKGLKSSGKSWDAILQVLSSYSEAQLTAAGVAQIRQELFG